MEENKMDIMEERNMMDRERETLLKSIMTATFAAIDYNLYLDTHPDSKMALAKFKDYVQRTQALTERYEAKYGPLTAAANAKMDTWKWIENPYPWDREMT
jgi:spore coat protein JB